jgi:hypothetical protein
MKDYKKIFIASCLGLALALFGWAPRADACYLPPTLAAESSFSAFAADFNRWDASLDYQPLLALAATPDQERTDMVLVLWWLWMNGYGQSSQVGGPGGLSLSSFFPPPSPEQQPPVDTTSGGSILPIPPLGDNSPPTPPIGIVTSEPSDTPPPSGGDDPQGGNGQPNIDATPEPSTLALLGLGIATLAGYGWRRRSGQA